MTEEDRRWHEEFRKGLVKPQPIIGPTVDEYARMRIKQIDQQIEELQSEKRRYLSRLSRKDQT